MTKTLHSPTEINWGIRLSRVLLMAGILALSAGFVGEIYFFASVPQAAVMVKGPPEDQIVHGLCSSLICGGTLATLLGGLAWLLAVNQNRIQICCKTFVAALGPAGGRYDGRDSDQDRD